MCDRKSKKVWVSLFETHPANDRYQECIAQHGNDQSANYELLVSNMNISFVMTVWNWKCEIN